MSIYTIEEINQKYSNYGLKPYERFSREVITEVSKLNSDLSKEDLLSYEDHTKKNIVTIDGDRTLDVDDAILVEKVGKFYSLTVYIADVSFYVKEGSKLDAEALRRGTSIYTPNKTLNMLPVKLCHDTCSLKENKERLTLAVNMVFNQKGKLKSRRIFKAIISSKKKMTYDKVDKVLENSDCEVVREYSNFTSQLFLMKKLALILRKRRKKNHFLELNIPEFEFYIPTSLEFEHISIKPCKRTISTIIIEEFMLAANFNVAQIFHDLCMPFIYRTHARPSLNNFNFDLKVDCKKIFKDESYLAKLLAKKLENVKKKKRILFSFNILNSLSSAKYSDVPSGHFALNAKYYCHFTSPIRRYPDLFIHRIISQYLEEGFVTDEMIEKYTNLVPEIAQKCSDAEAFAKRVSRDLENMYIAYYMQDFIGEKFKASVYNISKNHISVFINDVMVTGKIKISSLYDDSKPHPIFYKNEIFLNENSSIKLRDNLIVTLVDIDKNTHTLIFEIV